MLALDSTIGREASSKSEENGSKNGKVRIDERLYTITCPRFRNCKGPTYNIGFTKYLCSFGNHMQCATENPSVCMHPQEFLGRKIKKYEPREESMNYA